MGNNSGVRVLVIEDDADLRKLIHEYLEMEGHEVVSAADGHEGMQCQRTRPADVVVTDILMPGKEGIQTIFELRREFPATKVIAMSGGSERKDLDYLAVALQVGAATSLKKPFRLEQLARAMRELI